MVDLPAKTADNRSESVPIRQLGLYIARSDETVRSGSSIRCDLSFGEKV